MPRSPIRLFAAVSLFIGLLGHPALAQSTYERPVTLQTASVLPGVPLYGVNYQIAPTVQNDGFINSYALTVKGKTYQVDGTDLLLYRLQELRALEVMDLRSGSSTFTSAAGKAIKAPVEGAKSLVTSPIQTTKGFVSGVGSFFESLGHAATGSSSAEEEGVFKTAIGYGVARRKVAGQFRIDPYTNFPPVKEKLADLSWASTGGNLTVGAGFSAIPGGAGKAVSGTKATRGFNQLVYDKSPADLKDSNENRLTQMQVTPALIRTFLNHPQFTPSHTTEIVDALASIPAHGRGEFIARAVLVDNETAAFFMMRWAQMYAAYTHKFKAISRFVRLGMMPIAQREDGTLVAMVPSDHVLWTAGLATRHMDNMKTIRAISGVTGGEVWLAGSISPVARKNLEAQNWVVKDNQGRALGLR